MKTKKPRVLVRRVVVVGVSEAVIAADRRRTRHGDHNVRNAATEVRLALLAARKDVARGIPVHEALARSARWYRLRPREIEALHAWYEGHPIKSAYGNVELQPGKFYGYKGHQVWLDKAPGGGWFALISGTAVEGRGATPAEAMQKIRAKLESGAANFTRHGDVRFGVPMGQGAGRQYATMLVTVEYPDGSVKIKRWRGGSAKSIRAAAREAYPGAKLGFGGIMWHQSWGAH